MGKLRCYKIVDVIQDDQLRHAIAEATDADALISYNE
ncbi:hypothetical protein AAULR_25286, partial [Lacticaseibacillus rhamnosus MTCC 5462]